MIVYAIAVLGLILLTGFNGQISLGHGAFFAVGAYTAAILIDQAGWPFWATLPAAALACFVAGYLFGLPALRLEGHYLALATFALAVAVPQILKYRHIEPLTKGVMGINVFKSDPPFGLPLSTDQWMFLVVLAVAALMFWIARNLLDSRTGRALIAIRDHPMAASTMGVNVAPLQGHGVRHQRPLHRRRRGAARHHLRVRLARQLPLRAVDRHPGRRGGGRHRLAAGGRDRRRVRAGDREVRRCPHQEDLSERCTCRLELEPWLIYGIALIVLMYTMPTGIAGGLAALWRRLKGS